MRIGLRTSSSRAATRAHGRRREGDRQEHARHRRSTSRSRRRSRRRSRSSSTSTSWRSSPSSATTTARATTTSRARGASSRMKLIGYTEVAHTLFPRMGAGASAVLFGGLASERPYPGSTSITTVNGAVSSLIRTLAVELAPVRFNAIHPGIISDSPAWEDKKEAIAQHREAHAGRAARDDGGRRRRRRLPVHEPRRQRHQPRHRRRLAADVASARPSLRSARARLCVRGRAESNAQH